MEALSTWHRVGRWFPLGGSLRALGDARQARQVLLQLAAPAESYRTARSKTVTAAETGTGHGVYAGDRGGLQGLPNPPVRLSIGSPPGVRSFPGRRGGDRH
jgi:hypothetical protein